MTNEKDNTDPNAQSRQERNNGDELDLKNAPWYVRIIEYVFKKRLVTTRDIVVFIVAFLVITTLEIVLIPKSESISRLVQAFVADGSSQYSGDDKIAKALLLQGHRHFQWQWAGENWLGYVTFNEVNDDIEAELDLDRVFKTTDGGRRELKKMRSEQPGIVEISDDKISIKRMRVRNWVYGPDNQEPAISEHLSTMEFELHRTLGFEGTVVYKQDGHEEAEGNIALVYHRWVP